VSIAELLDRYQIAELKHAYCWAFDEADLEGLMALFTADAVCELGTFGTWTGGEEIRSGYRHQFVASKVPGGRLHSVSNPVLRISGDNATGRWYVVDYDIEAATVQPVRILATYEDSYRLESGGWRIARTSLKIHWSDAAVPGGSARS